MKKIGKSIITTILYCLSVGSAFVGTFLVVQSITWGDLPVGVDQPIISLVYSLFFLITIGFINKGKKAYKVLFFSFLAYYAFASILTCISINTFWKDIKESDSADMLAMYTAPNVKPFLDNKDYHGGLYEFKSSKDLDFFASKTCDLKPFPNPFQSIRYALGLQYVADANVLYITLVRGDRMKTHCLRHFSLSNLGVVVSISESVGIQRLEYIHEKYPNGYKS